MAMTITGCGLRPALVRDVTPEVDKEYQKDIVISVKGIEGYLNHIFYQDLQKQLRLFKGTLPRPLLVKVTLGHSLYDVSYGRDATALRSQNVMHAAFEISHRGSLLKKGNVDSVSSYNLDRNDEFATLTSRMGSDDSVIRAIATEVAREVLMATEVKK